MCFLANRRLMCWPAQHCGTKESCDDAAAQHRPKTEIGKKKKHKRCCKKLVSLSVCADWRFRIYTHALERTVDPQINWLRNMFMPTALIPFALSAPFLIVRRIQMPTCSQDGGRTLWFQKVLKGINNGSCPVKNDGFQWGEPPSWTGAESWACQCWLAQIIGGKTWF